ncbi:interactor of constitutive active ROPs 2, chloroplastic [Rhodamnia argentea]|uniref:Interactor of constitutive active ROPs 2, chloroplastic n=1 Tax=Rhodamnia argentea TaxID=178133 RepID=A0A8B8Q8B5_9MYRT|nr:interactor of constitutive active ROPs 2, chloroplastic [Rhodamnia argentea]XP_030542544.1 interactor of constitutive active ROPs 2, chloroplastic [Rhodamnia argentea]XP_030542545.1 interactor of constitutive active ROPs 2, chloroplastic [Rhodamnia argentea]XP_030542546.1 interactor of constitutive active ROPs 2, chloroplastic [Rhodamnia argentea]XP_048138752.1 interactor of constitutive active ROPs 2, chloroplastic [Rhodamnia argentea]
MQTPQARTNSQEVPQRKSPRTPRTSRQLKIPGSDLEKISSSPNAAARTPKGKSPKVGERKSPRSSASAEKKCLSRASELESQIIQLQEDLKKAKNQLDSSELAKRQAQQEAEEARKQLLAMSKTLEELQQQLLELSASEEARVQELLKISQDRDKSWQSELEAIQKQYTLDSAALGSAMNEIKKLKAQLEMVAESEATQTKHAESAHHKIQHLRMELSETLALVENLRIELTNCRESEAQALEVVNNSQKQLEAANATVEIFRTESMKAKEAYSSLFTELEQSKSREKFLDDLVKKLQPDLSGSNNCPANSTSDVNLPRGDSVDEDINELKAELNSVNLEAIQLKSALGTAETRYQEEYIQSTLQIRSAYETAEHIKLESFQRQAKLEAELEAAKSLIEELTAKSKEKEAEFQSVLDEHHKLIVKKENNQGSARAYELKMDLSKSQVDLEGLKENLLGKARDMHNLAEENERLKNEMNERDVEKNKANDEAVALVEAARAAEREALMKLGYLTEEADKSSRRAARVTEQLDAAQAANSEMEAELRRLKVQSDQWRKAAEAAATILSAGNNGKFVERTGSLDNYHTLGSPYSEDMDDESPKKNGNVLKRIGVLWKKGNK